MWGLFFIWSPIIVESGDRGGILVGPGDPGDISAELQQDSICVESIRFEKNRLAESKTDICLVAYPTTQAAEANTDYTNPVQRDQGSPFF